LIHTGKERGYTFQIMEAVDRVNEAQKLKPLIALKEQLPSLKKKTVAVWGLAFKPRTDDVREAPALLLIQALLKEGARVRAFDPVAEKNAQEALKGARVDYCDGAYEALEGADALVIVTEWDEFRTADYEKMRSAMKNHLIVDGRNILERKEAEAEGFVYCGIGV
jgi:UDPglucose 6-dehydrogenase